VSRYIFTVGKNELPVHTGARALVDTAPPGADVVWLATNQSRKELQQIRDWAGCNGREFFIDPYEPIDARDVAKISPDREPAHLNITGGTKPMAVHAALQLGDVTLSYLDAEGHRLWIEGQACSEDLRQLYPMDLVQLAALHGVDVTTGNPDDPSTHWSQDFEKYTYKQLKDALGGQPVYWDVKLPGLGHAQLDVAAVVGYQLLLVSCTLMSTESDAESKAYEVWHRARQIGGGAARAIVLCNLTQPQAEAVEKRVFEDLATKYPVLHVWGRDKQVAGLIREFRRYAREELGWKEENP
jgi:hypothetical protein